VYLRWFAVMLRDPSGDEASGAVVRSVPWPALAALVLSGAVLLVTSVLPQLVMGLVE
jgi:NADH-quinone oxidoreductase subunit N